MAKVKTPKAKAPKGSTPHWFTSSTWFLRKEEELIQKKLIDGPFTIDLFAHPDAPVSNLILRRGGQVFYEKGDIGPKSPKGVRFANPPYDAKSLNLYMPTVAIRGRNTVALVPAWPDRKWWHVTVEPFRLNGLAHIEFIPGRLTFGWPGNEYGQNADTAMFPSALVVYL